MQNVEMKVVKGKLVITVDLKAAGTESKSGKTIVVASTRGNAPVPGNEDCRIGLNLYRYKNGK